MVEKVLSLWCCRPKWRKPARSRSSVSAVWPPLHMPIVRSGEPIWTWFTTFVYKTQVRWNKIEHTITLSCGSCSKRTLADTWCFKSDRELSYCFFNISRIFLDLGKYLMFQVWSWALLFLFPPTGWQFNRSAATLATWQEIFYFVHSYVRGSFSQESPYSTQSYVSLEQTSKRYECVIVMHLFGHELDPTLTEDSVVLPLLLVSLVRLQEHSTNSDIEILNWSSDI